MIEKNKKSNNLDIKINDYNELENSIKEVFYKYELDFNKRFNLEENKLFINNKINDLQKTEREIDFYKK